MKQGVGVSVWAVSGLQLGLWQFVFCPTVAGSHGRRSRRVQR